MGGRANTGAHVNTDLVRMWIQALAYIGFNTAQAVFNDRALIVLDFYGWKIKPTN